MTIKPIFAWYDLWVGAYWSADTRALYVFPIPCVGIRVGFGQVNKDLAALEAGVMTVSQARSYWARTANVEPPRDPWRGIFIGLLLMVIVLASLAAVAMMIGGPS
jgi:hypothetical protein